MTKHDRPATLNSDVQWAFSNAMCTMPAMSQDGFFYGRPGFRGTIAEAKAEIWRLFDGHACLIFLMFSDMSFLVKSDLLGPVSSLAKTRLSCWIVAGAGRRLQSLASMRRRCHDSHVCSEFQRISCSRHWLCGLDVTSRALFVFLPGWRSES